MTPKRVLMIGCAAGSLMLAESLLAQAFNANPATVAGMVKYDRATPGVETVTVESPTAIINWAPNVAGDPINFLPELNTATFNNGPNNVDFVVLNRILTTTPVQFNGTVRSRIANAALGTEDPGGTVLFSSPGGIIIGSTALFDVGNLVLTSLNVVDDGAGNFYDPATRGVRFEPFLGLPPRAVVTQADAHIFALSPNSYVAMVAPQVVHEGLVLVNGSAAYVAAQRVQFRANQGLFDIIVDTGTGVASPLDHVGVTGGPSSVAADDVQRIYMVAVPTNLAITARLLGGSVGFEDSLIAGVENGAIVLSAGHSIVGGEVDRFGDASPPPVPGVDASFRIGGGTIRSDLIGVAVTDMMASGENAGSLNVLQDISLFGGARAHLFTAQAETVTVAGNVLVSAARLRSADAMLLNLVGGEARIFAQGGGAIAIAGDATVDASAEGGFNAVLNLAGSGTGGSAGIFADQGNVGIAGNTFVLAIGSGPKLPTAPDLGGAGIGGTAFVEGRPGGAVALQAGLAMDASGIGGESNGALAAPGAAGTGGDVRIATTGGSLGVGGPVTMNADGLGGAVLSGPGNNAGIGQGGDAFLTVAGGTINLSSTTALSASGLGGAGPVGGSGLGGNVLVDVANGQVQFLGAATLTAAGTGGAGMLPGGMAQGGVADGGLVQVLGRTGAAAGRVAAFAAFDASALATGGKGGAASAGGTGGAGGAAQGGDVILRAESGNGALDFAAVTAFANGQGGTGGDADMDLGGGAGGLGTGGTVQVGTVTVAAPGTGGAGFASLDLRANGLGGAGGTGQGIGGNAQGGTAALTADGAPVAVTGATALAADGLGGAGGGSPGGGVGAIGQAAGGDVRLGAAGAGGTLGAGDVAGTASATGVATGVNTAGQWHVNTAGGGAINLANLNLTAAANGPPAVPPFSSLEMPGGSLSVTQVATFSTPGEIRVIGDGAGRIAGGRYTLTAGGDVVMTHTNPVVGGFTVDVTGLFVVAGADFSAGAGVVTRSANQTDIAAVQLATIAGRILGRQINLDAATIDVAAGGGVGNGATLLAELRAIGDASVAGQVLGRDILVASATLDVAATGGVGDATSVRTELRTTGAATIAGGVQGADILITAADVGVGPTAAIGAATTQETEIRAVNAATLGGTILGQNIIVAASGITAGGTIGGTGTAQTSLAATGDAAVSGNITGGAILINAANVFVEAAGAVGDAVTQQADIRAVNAANIAGNIRGAAIDIEGATVSVSPLGTVGGAGTGQASLAATGNAAIAGRVLGGDILISGANVDVALNAAVGDGATQEAELQAVAAATIGGTLLGQAVIVGGGQIDVAATGIVGGAGTGQASLIATGDAAIAGDVLGGTILVAGANVDVTGAVGDAATQQAGIQAANAATISGTVLGRTIAVGGAQIDVAASGAVGAAATNQAGLTATGDVAIAGNVLGTGISIAGANVDVTGAVGDAATQQADLRATGIAFVAGAVRGRTVTVEGATIAVAATGLVGGAGTDLATLRAGGNAALSGRVLGREILVASSDIDLPAGGILGDAGTERTTLQVTPVLQGPAQPAVIGGTAPGTGYTLTNAEAGRIRAGTLRILAPAAGAAPNRPADLLIRDLGLTGGGAAAGIGALEIETAGIGRVEGAVLLANAAAANGISLTARERLEIATSTGSVRVRDGAGAPAGTLLLASNNIWIASQPVIDRLRADPAYAARDADLLVNGGTEEPRGYAEANAVELAPSGTLFVQNSGPPLSQAFAGITVGPGPLTLRPAGNGPSSVTAFGRRLNADGSITTGPAFFFLVDFQAGGQAGGYTLASTFNTCFIVTGQCGGPQNPLPDGADGINGPLDPDTVPPPFSFEANDLVDTSFAAEGLIEEPVTSGGESILWEPGDCDRDDDGDCDEGGR